MKSDYLRMLLQSKDRSAILDTIAQTSFDELAEIDLNGNTIRNIAHIPGKYMLPSISGSYSLLYAYAAEKMVHPDDRDVFCAVFEPNSLRERLDKASSPGFLSVELRNRLENGGWGWTEQVLICGERYGLPAGIVQLYIYDIQAEKEMSARGSVGAPDYRSMRDELTGLYTEKAFFALSQERIPGLKGEWCMIAIDIEHFKLFRDWNGQEKAARLLSRYGGILREYAERHGGLAGYRGQDDFCLMIPYERADIDGLFESLKGILQNQNGTAGFLPIFGVCLIGDPDGQALDLFNHAALTAEAVKGNYRTRIQLYDAAMQEQSTREFRMLGDFQRAFEDGEITFYLQPQCRVSNGAVVGAESLARWRRPDGSFISPEVFVPVMEKHGIITNLDQFIWESVCAWLRGVMDRGIEPVPVSVNVSRVDLFTIDVPGYLKELIAKYNLPPKYLKVEITESAYAEDSATVGDAMRQLREMGFMVLMDDFGSGYSSLNMLRSLSVDIIKLDAQFLHFNMQEERRGISIVESIINMTQMLGTPVIIEGVESPEQVRFLADLGCRYMQGFYFYRPMTTDDFEAILADSGRVDYKGFIFKANQQLHIREFMDANIYSDAMLNNMLGPVCFYRRKDDNVDILRFNQQFYLMVGLDADELEERRYHIQKYFHPEDVPAFFRLLSQAERDRVNGACGVFRVYKPNGTIFWMRAHVYYMDEDVSGKTFYASTQDVTELQYVNVDLPGGYYRCTTDNGYQFLYISQNFLDMTGFTAEEIRAKFKNRLLNMLHPNDRAALKADANAIAAGNLDDIRPYRLKHKNGGYIYVAEKNRLTDRFGSLCWQCVTIEITETMKLRNQMRLLTAYLSSSIVFVHMYKDRSIRYEVAVHGLEKTLGMDLAAFQQALNDGSFLERLDTPAEHRSRDRYWEFRGHFSDLNDVCTYTPPEGAPVRLRCRFDGVPQKSGNVVCIIAFSVE